MKRGELATRLGIILLAGFMLRFMAIDAQPLWSDEALTHLTIRFPPFDLLRYPLDPTAPLYFWLQGMLGGDDASRAASRALSLLFGTLAILPAALAGRELGGKWGALAAGATVALSPALIDYSHEGRAYALLIFLLAGFTWLSLSTLRRDSRPRDLASAALAGVLALYTHLVALFVVGPVMMVLGWSWLARRKPAGWPWAALAMAVAYLPEANRLRLYHKKMHVFEWLQQPSPWDALSTLGKVWMGIGGVTGVAAIAVLLFFAWRNRSRDRFQTALVVALLGSAILVYSMGFVTPMFMDRTVLPSTLGVAAAWSLVVRERRYRACGFIALTILALSGLLIAGIDRPKEQWDRAAAAAALRPGPLIVCPRWQTAPLLAALGDVDRPDVLVPAVRGITLVPKGGHWADQLFAYQFRDEWAHHRKLERYPSRSIRIDASVATIVTGQCTAEERRHLERWFGPHRTRLLWQGRGVYSNDRIVVEQWIGTGQQRSAILAVPGRDVRRP